MNELLLQLGAGGILCVVVLQVVFTYLGKKSVSSIENQVAADLSEIKANLKDLHEWRGALKPMVYNMEHKLEELHEWHNNKDEDGVFTWYIRKSLERSLSDLADAVQIMAQNTALQSQALEQSIKSSHDTLNEVKLLREDNSVNRRSQ